MNRRIVAVLLVGLVIQFGASTAAKASECVSWAETTDLPDAFPEIQLTLLAVVGSLLVGTMDQEFFVYRLAGQSDPELVATVPIDQDVRRIRVLDGQVYLLPWTGTSWRVDLSDPTSPQFVTVAVPAGTLRDIVRFDGGYLMLTSADIVFVVDDPTAAVSTIAAFEIEDPNRAASHGSIVFVAMNRGVQTVDLADPADPIVGEFRSLHPPGGGLWTSVDCRGLVVHEGSLYGNFGYFSYNTDAAFTMAIDITDPFEPTPIVWRPETGVDDGLEIMGDRVVVLTRSTLQVYETGDLAPVATIRANEHGASAGAAFGEDYLITIPFIGLHRVDLRNPFTVEPAMTMPDGYDPAGCGRYGLATRRTYVYDWEGRYLKDVDWTIYDQTSVTALDSLAGGHIDVYSSEYESYGYALEIADANDRWVVVRAHGSCGGEYYSYDFEDLFIHDLQTGACATVNQRESGRAALAGDVLWTLCWITYNQSFLQTFRLTEHGVVQLGSLELPYGTYQLYVDDEVYVASRSTVTVLSLSAPDDLTPVRELQVDQDVELTGPGYVDGGRLFAVTSEGVAVVDLDPASPDAPVVIGSCVLGLGGVRRPLVRQGNRAILHRYDGWQAVDLSDPTAPVAASPVVAASVSGMHWSGDLLYVNTGGSIHLYDVTDLADPQWVGQSTYLYSLKTSPCGLDGYVISAEHALFPDCNDIVPIEPIEPIEPEGPVTIPAAVTLAPVAPNPFNPSTSITFDLRRGEHVELDVYDLRGRRVATLLDRPCESGRHQVSWRGCDDRGRSLPSGCYVVQLRTDTAIRSTRAVLMR